MKTNKTSTINKVLNPEVMGVFAYSSRDKVGNVKEFVEHQEDFLKEYAISRDIPMIIFGD